MVIMKHQIVPKFLSYLLILIAILLLSTTWTIAQEVEDETEFDYIEGSKKGPLNWGELKKEWATCKTGIMQSPIDMANHKVRMVAKLGKLIKNYKPQNATIKNRGHDIQMKWEGDAGSININGSNFFLHQVHWHWPSEHTINERRFDMEVHMVHESSKIKGKSKIAVVGILYKIGRPDPFLAKMSKYLKAMVDTEGERSIGVINPSKIKFGGKKYYRYIGSLTIPPCNVIWTINKRLNIYRIRSVSKEQMKLFRDAVHDNAENNARPVQLLNEREIHLYGSKVME